MKKLFLILALIFLVCSNVSCESTLNLKGEVIGMMGEESGATLILRTKKEAMQLILLDSEQAASNILSAGDWADITVRISDDGIVRAVSLKKTPKIVTSKKRVPDNSKPYTSSYGTLAIYKKTIKYFNPKLNDRDAERIASSILYYARLHKIDPRLIVAVVAAESDFHINARSVKGAVGLGQLMPGTAKILKVNPLIIEENILGTSSYLKSCIDQWKKYPYVGLDLAVASYNAGSGAVEKYGGVPPYKETQAYVKKVMGIYKQLCTK